MNERAYVYAWGNNSRRAELKGRRCVIEVAGGSMRTVLVRFLDTGERVTTSRRALRDAPAQEWKVWTDGSGTTGGPAGIGYVAQSPDEPESVLGSLPLKAATNQQAELLAAALALHELPAGSVVTVVSDSEYLVKGWNEYPERKRKRNLPHWARLTEAAKRHRSVAFEWTRGHAGTLQNEVADQIAGAARQVAIKQAEREVAA